MNVRPTCRFCQRELVYLTAFRNPKNESLYSYQCVRCNSEQLYTKDGAPATYNFKIAGTFELRFLPGEDKPFKVYALSHVHLDGTPFTGKPVLELDFMPQLTPQNCSLERIKTLILFS